MTTPRRKRRARELFDPQRSPFAKSRVVKPRKGKGSFKRQKKDQT